MRIWPRLIVAAALSWLCLQPAAAAERLVVVSKGEEELVCREDTDACHARNRRGRFVATAK